MYLPARFHVEDPETLRALVRQHSFATLVTVDGEGLPFASHVPLLLESGDSVNGALLGHIARANPQWRHFRAGSEVLAIFTGPHSYVSPAWYESQPSVPTWNYVAVHVYGRPHLIEEADEVRELLRRMTDSYEASRPRSGQDDAPWRMEDLPDAYVGGLLKGIVAFRIEVTRWEGKWKLGQNRSEADREQVIAALHASRTQSDHDLAEMMRSVR